SAFANIPTIVPDARMLLGVCGYRPDVALKTGMGLSIGGDYAFRNYRIFASYQYQDRYQEGASVPILYINHIYDNGETIMIGVERAF
ncbi:MAG: hypothetical protein KAH54_11250, partial [Candidatus Sabulitectum sp.]|nr:hypothetical protein [Candidatus Sabulitectum sp.]